MIVRFDNKKVRELYECNLRTCVSRYKYAGYIVQKYKLRISQLIDAPDLRTISQIKSLNLEKLRGDRKGQLSIRINEQYRICFRELNEKEIAIEIIDLTDYH